MLYLVIQNIFQFQREMLTKFKVYWSLREQTCIYYAVIILLENALKTTLHFNAIIAGTIYRPMKSVIVTSQIAVKPINVFFS